MKTESNQRSNPRLIRNKAESAGYFSQRLLFCLSLSVIIGLNSCNNVKTTGEIPDWSDAAKEYPVTAFEQGVQKLDARHSVILKYNGSQSFNELSEALSVELNELFL